MQDADGTPQAATRDHPPRLICSTSTADEDDKRQPQQPQQQQQLLRVSLTPSTTTTTFASTNRCIQQQAATTTMSQFAPSSLAAAASEVEEEASLSTLPTVGHNLSSQPSTPPSTAATVTMLMANADDDGPHRRSSGKRTPAAVHSAHHPHSMAHHPHDVMSVVSSSASSTTRSSSTTSGTATTTTTNQSLKASMIQFWRSLITVSCVRCDGRISISLVVVLILGLASILSAGIGLAFIMIPLQDTTAGFLHKFADETVLRTATFVDSRFARLRSMADLAERVTSQKDIIGSPPDFAQALAWFGRDLYANNFHLLIFRGPYAGFTIAPVSPSDPYNYGRKEGYVVVANATNSATTSAAPYMEFGYFSVATFQPLNATVPFTRNYTTRFNFTARPYGPLFMSRKSWSNPYVGVLTRTSSIGIGGPWGASVGAPTDSTYSLHDYTEDVVAYLKGLQVSQTGVVLLIDVKSRAFVGGNVNDVSIKNNINGTPQLVLLEGLQDPRASKVIAAAATPPSATVYTSALLTCAAPCEMVYSNGMLFPVADRHFSLFEEYVLVRVGAITDDLGLNMRLIVILPASDFVDGAKNAALRSIYVTALVVGVTLLIVFVLVHLAMRPLREIEAFLLYSARLGHQHHPHLVAASSSAAVLSRSMSGSTSSLTTTPQSERDSESGSHRGTPAAQQQHQHRSHQQQQAQRWLYNPASSGGTSSTTSQLLSNKGKHTTSFLKEVNLLCSATAKLAAELKLFSTFLPQQSHLSSSLLLRSSGSNHNPQRLDASSNTTTTTTAVNTQAHQSNSTTNAVVNIESPSEIGTTEGDVRGGGGLLMSSLIIGATSDGGGGGGGASTSLLLNHHHLHHNARRSDNGTESRFSVRTISSDNGGVPYAFDTLWRVPVTTVVCNLVRFDTLRKSLQHTELSKLHSGYLGVVQEAARAHGGSIELLHGDRVWVHVNAIKRVVGHAAAACRMMLAIERGMKSVSRAQKSSSFAGIRLGASTGRALCGFMGASCLRNFTVVGDGVAQAAALIIPVRLAGGVGAPSAGGAPQDFPFMSLMSPKTAQLALCSKDVVPRHVRLSLMPYETDVAVVSTPVLLDHVLEAYPSTIGLTSPAAALSRLRLVNTIFDHLVLGQTREAQRLLQGLSHPDDEWLLRTFSL